MDIAIVTGASSGMGREMVFQLADRFGGSLAEIWVIARRKERLESLRGLVSAPLRVFPLDLTGEHDLDLLQKELELRRPQVRILVNAAGCGRMGTVGGLAPDVEERMIRLNCQALCAVTRLVLPWIARHGRIIQFASAAAFLPQPGFGIYAATKAFVLSYSRALGAELRPRDIAVTAVCPGAVKTEFFDREQLPRLPSYKKLVMADSRRVVRCAIRDSVMGREVSVYGPFMQGFWLLTKLVPHGVLLRVMGASASRADSGTPATGEEGER